MSVEINIVYKGELRCEALHVPSNAKLITDAPLDNRGKASSFSPTDLVATALGSCVMTIIAIMAERSKVDLTGTKITVIKEMADAPLRRIGKLKLRLDFPKGASIDESTRRKFERAVDQCPVKQSLNPDIVVEPEFHYV